MHHRHRLAPLALPGLMLLALTGSLRAQDVSVRAYLTPGADVGVGRSFVLNVEITGSQSLDQDPDLPDLGSFAQYLGSGSSTSMQMAGGRTTVSRTIQYRYQALQTGTFEIPAVTVVVSGERYTTDRLTVTVRDAPPEPTEQRDAVDEAAAVGPDDLFVTAEASRDRVREGEPFVVEYRIWTRVDVASYSLTAVPEPEGFWVEALDVEQEGVEQVTRDGERYATAVIRRVALVPTTPGDRTLDPLGVQAQVRVRRRIDPFEGLFGGRSLFGAAAVPVTVRSNPLTIAVEPLPAGRPEPYSGVVGSLEVTASLDRGAVEANEAVTLTVRVQGEGNIRTVPEPRLDLPDDFEIFPPEVSESVRGTSTGLSGSKTFEYVLIPRAPGDRSLPPVSMGYFDTRAGEFRVATSGEIPLTVTGTAGPAAGDLTRGGVTPLREDIRFIELGDGALRPSDRGLFGRPGFWILFLLPMAGVLGAVALRRHQDRLEGDVAYARSRRAARAARKRLGAARRLQSDGEPRAFYAEVARAVRGFVADKLNVSEAGLRISYVARSLDDRGVPRKTVEEVESFLEECDRQRFAPPSSEASDRRTWLERAEGLMAELGRSL